MKLDIIGDIHGCYDEFTELTNKLGYVWTHGLPIHKEGRRLAFVGDLTDRGPKSLQVITTVSSLVKNDLAYYVPGNHCNKLYRFLIGNKVQITNGLETTVAEYHALNEHDRREIRHKFITLYENAPLYKILESGKLIIAHAGIREDYIGKTSEKVKTFVLYGDITGEKNPDGSPVRRNWTRLYKGKAMIVYGHTPMNEVQILNNTYNIDTGAVFGNKLSSLQYPEMKIVSVQSSMPYVKEKFNHEN